MAALTVTATITTGIPNNGITTILFTNTTSGITGLVSKILVISNYLGVVIDTVNMGSSNVATYDVSSDQYLQFVLTIIDGSGTSIGTFDYVSTGFFDYGFSQLTASVISGCCDTFGVIFNLNRALIYKTDALNQGIFSNGVNANNLIVQANYYITTPYYAN